MTNGLLVYGENLRISSYIRKLLVIYDFAPDPIWISLYMKKILFSFLSVSFVQLHQLWIVCSFLLKSWHVIEIIAGHENIGWLIALQIRM